jgi:hypothetical protein
MNVQDTLHDVKYLCHFDFHRQGENSMPLLHTRTRFSTLSGAVAFIALMTTGCSPGTMHKSLHGKPAQHAASAHDKSSQPTTYSIQDDSSAWKRSPQLHAYYDLTVAAFARGNNIDVDAYEAQSFALFREFARANRVNEQAMLDHLKLIPRQVVGIVKEDPAVLTSYDNFWVALVGPE